MERYRPASAPVDIVIGGQERTADAERDRALTRSFAESGATWWIEYVRAAELDVMRARITRGPLRID